MTLRHQVDVKNAHFDPRDLLAPLTPRSYGVIMADPAWGYETWSSKGWGKSPQGRYRCMPTSEIAALPVGELALPDCWLWLWGTFPMLDDARYVLGAWGFRYVTGGSWIKVGASGKLAMGPGKILRGNAELFMIGKKGVPRVHARDVRNAILAPGREHSRKPDDAYAAAERLFGPARRADLFSRETRPGWEAFGDQAGAFDAKAVGAA